MTTSAPTLTPEQIEALDPLFDQFQQLEHQLQHVREGLTRSHRLATLGTIASIIAHEYNNILTPIISYAQLALADPNDQELLKKAVAKALAGAERAAHISSSLLGFAREADEAHAADLRKTVDEAIACLARDPRKEGIDLILDIAHTKAAISPVDLQQVLVNLILNAKQAMFRAGGQLRISARADADLVNIEVADTGPGIPESIRDRLFEPFVTHRPENSTAKKGTGLGLCICKDLIHKAGGSISLNSSPQGTTFTITLPKADDLLE